jgi:hypothetical protein
MNELTYIAHISNSQGKILVTIVPPNSGAAFSRSFHAICDAECWLSKLVHVGMSTRDCARLQEDDLGPFALAATGPIRIIDNRRAKRCSLPSLFTGLNNN